MRQKLLGICSALLLALLAFSPASADDSMTVDDIIAKNIESKGGTDAWDNVESAKLVGNVDMGGGMVLPMTLFFRSPDKVRIEMEMQGNKIIQAYDGEIGWQIMPLMGKIEPQRMNDEEVKQVKRQADFEGPLFDYAEKGHEVKLVGKEEIEGTEAFKLEVTLDTGDVSYMYLDTDYFLEFKQKGTVMAQGQEVTTDVTYGDYKEVGDIVVAHSIQVKPEGAPAGMTLTFENVEINPEGVDDSLFAMPEVESAPAENAEPN